MQLNIYWYLHYFPTPFPTHLPPACCLPACLARSLPSPFLSVHLCRDISHNAIATVGRRVFKGAQSLRSLQLDNNQITCMEEHSFKGLLELEILWVYELAISHSYMPNPMLNLPKMHSLDSAKHLFVSPPHPPPLPSLAARWTTTIWPHCLTMPLGDWENCGHCASRTTRSPAIAICPGCRVSYAVRRVLLPTRAASRRRSWRAKTWRTCTIRSSNAQVCMGTHWSAVVVVALPNPETASAGTVVEFRTAKLISFICQDEARQGEARRVGTRWDGKQNKAL